MPRRDGVEDVAGRPHTARSVASVLPAVVRLDSCAQIVERARRRLAKAEEEFNRVQEERTTLAAELSEG